MVDVSAAVDALTPEQARDALKRLLSAAVTPAFGALSKREIDIALFGALCDVGAVAPDASLHEISTSLRITRSRASNLVFDRDMRRAQDQAGLDALVRTALSSAKFAKDGNYVALEVENPIVREHLKHHLRRLGHLSDASFNSAIVRMTLEGAADVATALLPDDLADDVDAALQDAGFEGRSLSDRIRSGLGKAGAKIGDKAADAGIGAAGAYLAPIAVGAAQALRAHLGL